MNTLIEVLDMQDLSSEMNNYCGGLRRAKSMVDKWRECCLCWVFC